MARDNPNPTFRTIPASNSYPGLTALPLPNGNELVSMGTGKAVERILMEAARER